MARVEINNGGHQVIVDDPNGQRADVAREGPQVVGEDEAEAPARSASEGALMAQTDGVGSPVFWDAYARVRVQTRGDLINGAIRQAAECRRVLRLPVDSPIAVFPPDWMRSCLSARDIEWLWREHAIEVKRLEDRFSDARLYTSPMIGFGRPAPIGAPPG